mmetsp:Transcript_218/g.719  ORF Transcript_218/g.719 Transcript_218/m.719 type:complete len:205 (-) Transcript_218:324-938(-)
MYSSLRPNSNLDVSACQSIGRQLPAQGSYACLMLRMVCVTFMVKWFWGSSHASLERHLRDFVGVLGRASGSFVTEAKRCDSASQNGHVCPVSFSGSAPESSALGCVSFRVPRFAQMCGYQRVFIFAEAAIMFSTAVGAAPLAAEAEDDGRERGSGVSATAARPRRTEPARASQSPSTAPMLGLEADGLIARWPCLAPERRTCSS